jgi:hypothetical protein
MRRPWATFGPAFVKRLVLNVPNFSATVMASLMLLTFYLHVTGQSLISEVNSLFTVVPDRSTRDEIVIICPEPGCGDQGGNRSINVKSGKTGCWRCNKGGDFVKWARRLGHIIDDSETSAVTISSLDTMADDMDKSERTFSPVGVEVSLPKGFVYLRDEPDSAYARLIGKMARRKNLSLDAFIKAGVGFTRESEVWEPFAIFPVYDWDKLVYYQGRTYIDKPGESTKKFPSRNELKYGSSCWVYNLDRARKTRAKTVIVVESILNVLSLEEELARRGIVGVVPVAVFKHAISNIQENKILAVRSVSEVCIMYDADAKLSAIKESKKFVNRVSISITDIPPGESGRTQDANDNAAMAVDQFLKRQFYNSAVSQLDADLLHL